MRTFNKKIIGLLYFIAAGFPTIVFGQVDVGALSLSAPLQQTCYGSNMNVAVQVKNFSTVAHNFATSPVTVNMNISGPAGTSTPSVVVNSGTLPAGDTLNVVVLSNFNMTVAGAYVFNANTSVTGDVNTANNSMQQVTINVQALSAGTVFSNIPAYCGTGGIPTLTLAGGYGGTIQWQESSTGNAGTWINVGTNNTSYTPSAAITATRYYRAYRYCNASADTSAVKILGLFNPQVLTTVPATICGPGTATLSATTTAGNGIYWYNAPSGGTQVGSGNTFVTQYLNSTTSFYATAFTNAATVDVGIKLVDFAACNNPVSSAAADYPLRFTTTKPLTINSAYVIPSSTSLTVALRPQGSAIDIATMSFTFTAAQIGSPQLIALGLNIPVPGNYQLTNTTGGLWRTVSTACNYPFISPLGSMHITGSATSSIATASTTNYNGFYQLNINEGCLSSPVPVVAQVNLPATITQQPVNVSTCVGATAYLIVGAQGTNLNYQWKKSGVNIANSNNDTLTFSPVMLADDGSYTVVITGSCGAPVTSSSNQLFVASTCVWSGSQNSDWNNAANWLSGFVPNVASNIIIGSNAPFQPVISSGAGNVNMLRIDPGASLTMASGSTLNIYGDFLNYGTFNCPTATVNFKGTATQTVFKLTAGNVGVNGSGIVLTEAMTVNQTLVLTNGNITLGINNLTINASTTGSLASHIITNDVGKVIAKNITNTPFTIPVGIISAYNPVVINNGGGSDYSVRVVPGFAPPIANSSIAVNRTWTITPNSAPASPVNISLQYDDTHMNPMGQAAATMHIGVYANFLWNLITGIVPTGSSSARLVSFSTTKFGPMAVANANGIVNITSVPTLNADISSIQLLPNVVSASALLKVVAVKASKVKWNVIDANGRVVMSFDRALRNGENDIQLQLQQLAPGVYSLKGYAEKGEIGVATFIKQ